MKFLSQDKEVLSVRGDGVVILVEKNGHVGTLKPDGSLELANGKIAAIGKDGKIVFDGAELPFSATGGRINEDGTALMPNDATITIEADGRISGVEALADMRVQGATKPESRRIALFLLILLNSPTDPPAPTP